MALEAGTASVTVHPETGAVVFSGTGLARAIAEADIASMLAAGSVALCPYPPPSSVLEGKPEEAQASIRADWLNYRQKQVELAAARAQAIAIAVVDHFTENAVARVTTQSLGRMPASTSEDTPIKAPAAPVDVPIQ